MKTNLMMKKTQLKQLVALTIFSIFTLFSCNKKEDTENIPIEDGLTILQQYVVDNQDLPEHFAGLPEDPNVFGYQDLYNELLNLSDTLYEQHTFSKVTYSSTDNHGNPITLSGLLINPTHGIHDGTPIISHNHGTELEKKLAPSQFVPGQSSPGDFAEVMIAWLYSAMNNWVVIMPDYQGMGEDVSELHPYCIKDRLAVSTADMLEAAKKTIKSKFNASWQGNSYIMGYSEGGYVTMAALEELEKRNVELKGAVIMEGPYDLSGSMREVMLADTAFPVPYFLPMMLVGYNDIYPDYFKFEEMLVSPYDTAIPEYTTGFYSTDFVNNLMPADHILKEVLTESFIDSLNNTNSNAHQALYENNTYINWIPTTETFIWHCENDDCVPFGNFLKVKSVFGSPSNITYKQYPPLVPIFHTIHQTAAPIAFLDGAGWIIERERE